MYIYLLRKVEIKCIVYIYSDVAFSQIESKVKIKLCFIIFDNVLVIIFMYLECNCNVFCQYHFYVFVMCLSHNLHE